MLCSIQRLLSTLLLAFAFSASLLTTAYANRTNEPAPARNAASTSHTHLKKMYREMLNPVVFVDVDHNIGSGVVIYSDKHGDIIQTYVLTSYHVIEGHIREEADHFGEIYKAYAPLSVKTYAFTSGDPIEKDKRYTANIVAHSKRYDLALLQFRSNTGVFTAHVANKNEFLSIFDQVWAIGSGLGRAPFPTKGELSGFEHLLGEVIHILFTAPTAPGNSGGGLFRYNARKNRYELIGITASVASKQKEGGENDTYKHMGFAVHIDPIHSFLIKNGYQFIVEKPTH